MENISKLRDEVLVATNVSAVIEGFTPITLTCENLKASLVEKINSASINTVSETLSIFNALNRQASLDTGAMKAADVLNESLNANSFKAKLVYCAESVQANKIETFKKITLEKLNTLAGMQIDEAKQAIRSGMLASSVGTYPELNLLVSESVLVGENNEVVTPDYKTYSPITLHVVESGNVYVRLANKVFGINPVENLVFESKAPNEKFVYISNVLESVDFNPVTKSFKFVGDEQFGSIEVSEGKVTRTVNETVTNFGIEDLSTKVGMQVLENANRQKAAIYKNTIDALLILNENANDIIAADQILVVEHINRNEKFAMFNLGSKQYVAVLQSNFSPMCLESFDNPVDAVSFMQKRSGYDATSFVAKEITEHQTEVTGKITVANEQVDIVNTIKNKIDEINEAIVTATAEHNQPQIDALNEALSTANALLIEQTNILASLTK